MLRDKQTYLEICEWVGRSRGGKGWLAGREVSIKSTAGNDTLKGAHKDGLTGSSDRSKVRGGKHFYAKSHVTERELEEQLGREHTT